MVLWYFCAIINNYCKIMRTENMFHLAKSVSRTIAQSINNITKI